MLKVQTILDWEDSQIFEQKDGWVPPTNDYKDEKLLSAKTSLRIAFPTLFKCIIHLQEEYTECSIPPTSFNHRNLVSWYIAIFKK